MGSNGTDDGKRLSENRWANIWNYLEGRPAEIKRSIVIPSNRVIDSGSIAPQFAPKKHYFAVVINEMFLAKTGQWWSEYDPMAFVVSEFSYNGKRRTVPFVVGPSLIEAKLTDVPNGMAITDTMVAGIHPYTGGKFALTVILAQVRRQSYARKLLQVVEKVAQAFPAGAALEPHLKVAGAVMEGIDELFGMEDTKPIAGHRWEYNDGISPWLEPGFFALIDADVKDVDENRLGVVKGRLCADASLPSSGFRKANFLLYSLRVVERRNDVEELPFYSLFKTALQSAATTEEGGWDRAKAQLATLFQEMLTSPDLTFDQVCELVKSYKAQFAEVRDVAQHLVLGAKDTPATLGNAAFTGDDGSARLHMLREIHSVLKLE
jgi:hypothetical protein